MHNWHIILWDFKNNKNITEIVKNISCVYCQGVITDRQVQNWFSKFCSGDMSLWDEHRPGCSSDRHHNSLRELVECNPHKSTWELALDLNTSQSAIGCHFREIGKVNKLGIWVPHNLGEKNKEVCIFIVTSLLSKQRNYLFFKNISPLLSYSPNLVPSDFHLFPSLQNSLNDKKISLRSGENVYGKLFQVENSWILFEKNQQAAW